MATVLPAADLPHARFFDALADPALAIAGPKRDALLFWGIPLLSLVAVAIYLSLASLMPHDVGETAIWAMLSATAITTYAHLIAVVPRAYLNRDVFTSHRRRLTIAPALLITALLLSKPLLVAALVLAVFWDVHHSAMQTFGLSRIYDMKAGNDARALRRIDLALNWALYVGPLAAGAALMTHLRHIDDFGEIGWSRLATMPGAIEGWTPQIRVVAIAAWIATISYAVIAYRRFARHGYRLPAHKAALLGSSALTSIVAWMAMPPFVALAVVNLFHAVQYFAIIWLKEGGRMRAAVPKVRSERLGFALFMALCAMFGALYWGAVQEQWIMAPFVACSLLHFWYDAFVWAVRKQLV